MSDNVVLIIILVVAGLAALAVAGYFIARFTRGSIKIQLSRHGFNEGEQVTGSFTLTTRKEIDGKRLFAALIGKEVTRERDGDNTKTHTREVYRNEQTIEEAKTHPAGQTTEYQFQIDTPSSGEEGFLDSGLGQALKMGMELIGGRRQELKWEVEVRLDAEGIDLAKSKSIMVNLSSTF